MDADTSAVGSLGDGSPVSRPLPPVGDSPAAAAAEQPPIRAELVEVRKIWDAGPAQRLHRPGPISGQVLPHLPRGHQSRLSDALRQDPCPRLGRRRALDVDGPAGLPRRRVRPARFQAERHARRPADAQQRRRSRPRTARAGNRWPGFPTTGSSGKGRSRWASPTGGSGESPGIRTELSMASATATSLSTPARRGCTAAGTAGPTKRSFPRSRPQPETGESAMLFRPDGTAVVLVRRDGKEPSDWWASPNRTITLAGPFANWACGWAAR